MTRKHWITALIILALGTAAGMRYVRIHHLELDGDVVGAVTPKLIPITVPVVTVVKPGWRDHPRTIKSSGLVMGPHIWETHDPVVKVVPFLHYGPPGYSPVPMDKIIREVQARMPCAVTVAADVPVFVPQFEPVFRPPLSAADTKLKRLEDKMDRIMLMLKEVERLQKNRNEARP